MNIVRKYGKDTKLAGFVLDAVGDGNSLGIFIVVTHLGNQQSPHFEGQVEQEMTAHCLVNLVSLVIFVYYKSSFFLVFLASFSTILSQKVTGGSVFNAAYLRKIEMLFKLCAVWR